MSELLTPADIERMARQIGIPMAEVFRRAGVAPSIFSRWKAGKTEPNLDNYRRIRDAAQGKLSLTGDDSQKPKFKRSRAIDSAEQPSSNKAA